jgi:hypothetical protein
MLDTAAPVVAVAAGATGTPAPFQLNPKHKSSEGPHSTLAVRIIRFVEDGVTNQPVYADPGELELPEKDPPTLRRIPIRFVVDRG